MSFKKFNFATRLLGTTKYFRSQELKGKKLVWRSPGSWSGWTWPDGPDLAAPSPRRCPNETLSKKTESRLICFSEIPTTGVCSTNWTFLSRFCFSSDFFLRSRLQLLPLVSERSLRRNFGTIFGALPRIGSGNKMSEAALFRNFG